MELKEAIQELEMLARSIKTDLEEEAEDNYKIAKAISTVLEELNNRIPRKKVEKLLEEIRKEYFDQINGKDRSLTTKNILTHQYNAMETVLEELLNKE